MKKPCDHPVGLVPPDKPYAPVRVACGRPLPLGTWPRDEGINFALFSRHARSVELLLYETPDASKHHLRIELDPAAHRTGDIWHVWVGGLQAGQAYAYHVDGPYQPESGPGVGTLVMRGAMIQPHRVAIFPSGAKITSRGWHVVW